LKPLATDAAETSEAEILDSAEDTLGALHSERKQTSLATHAVGVAVATTCSADSDEESRIAADADADASPRPSAPRHDPSALG